MNIDKALYDCYTALKQSVSNANLGIGTGKNISIAKLPGGKYIIRNGTKHIISYKVAGIDILYNMPTKHIICDELPKKFYVNELIPEYNIKDGYSLLMTSVNVSHNIRELEQDQIVYINQKIIDEHFIESLYCDLEQNDGFLYKCEIDPRLAKYISYSEETNNIFITFNDARGDLINRYTLSNSKYTQDNPNIILTNSLYKAKNLCTSGVKYIEKYIDRSNMIYHSRLINDTKCTLNRVVGDLTTEQIEEVLERLKSLSQI